MDLIFWVVFLAAIGVFLALDLGVFHRDAHIVTTREALGWTTLWVSLAIAFGIGVFIWQGSTVGIQWFTGYVVEYSLSVDNVFVFALVFGAFAVPRELQHRVLFWGVLGALVFRAAFIAAGTTLLESFHWMIYVFGGFLVFTGIRMWRSRDTHMDPSRNPVLRMMRRVIPMTDEYEGQKMTVRRAGKLVATPLLAVVVVVETTDVVFAVDSIPAIFAVTSEPFLVFTSNAFAILGLRALYFLLAGMIGRFAYLKFGLAAVLLFVGAKMLVADLYKVPIWLSLVVIATTIAVSIVASLRRAAGSSGERPRERMVA